MVLCLVNLIYIPAAFLVHPSVDQVIHNGFIPNFPGGFNGELFFFLMANIGTTNRTLDDLLPAECCRG